MIPFASRLAILLLSALAASAQTRHKIDINTETPEGQLLQKIGQEQDEAAKLKLMEDFSSKHSAHPAMAWVMGQEAPAYVKAKQWDKVFPVAEKLVALDPTDAEMAYTGLQAAVGKDDTDLIIKWAGTVIDAAKKGEKLPKPSNEDEVSSWEYKVKFSQQVQERAQYEVMTAGLRAQDPAKKIQLASALEQMSPGNKFIPQIEESAFNSFRQGGQNDKAIDLATKLAAKGAANEDMLLLLASGAFEKKQNDQVVDYSDKLVNLMKTKDAPQGVDAAAWAKKKNVSIGTGLFLKGMVLMGNNKLADADTVLREGVPFMEGNDALLGPTLFNLGLANYKMAQGKKPDMKRMKDALDFSRRAAAIKGSPFAGQAAKNVAVIQQQSGLK
ncbi:MAG: hypothetical protein U0Q16_29800 [Bryobacteraceae bacterium]